MADEASWLLPKVEQEFPCFYGPLGPTIYAKCIQFCLFNTRKGSASREKGWSEWANVERSLDYFFFGAAAVFVFFLQVTLLYFLWDFMGSVSSDYVCNGDYLYQLSLISTFLIFVTHSFQTLGKEFLGIFFATKCGFIQASSSRHIGNDFEKVNVKSLNDISTSIYFWKSLALILFCMESSIKVSVATVGCVFLMDSEMSSDVILTVVALCFINDLDYHVHSLISVHPKDLAFSIPVLSCYSTSDVRDPYYHFKLATKVVKLYGFIPILVAVSVGVVSGMRSRYC